MFFKKVLSLGCLISLLTPIWSKSQEKIPNVSGNVTINMKNGTIAADLTLTHLPDLDTAFRILLNRGMNVKFIRDSSGVVKYNDKAQDDFLMYRPHNGKTYLKSPKMLRVTYAGIFPVYTDTLNTFDYKGVIALNGKTLRAAEQSKWYPVIYDTKNDRELAGVTYSIHITCEDCKTIYLNGSAAQPGPEATFKSERPYELLLFTGNYEMQRFSSSDFLNAEMPDNVAEAFNQQIGEIKKFYEDKLKMPYQQKITFLQHTAIEPYGPNKSWGFVTFPTIAVAGGRFNTQIDMKTGKFNHIYKYSFYSHELAHYFFGTVLVPNSKLRWFFLESMAEYLSIKSAEKQYGKDSTGFFVKNAKTNLGKKVIVPLSKITEPEQVDELYRYSYGPMILLSLEKRIGEKRMYRLLQTALKYRGEKTDYSFLVKIALEAGVTKKEWEEFEEKVIGQTDVQLIFADFLKE